MTTYPPLYNPVEASLLSNVEEDPNDIHALLQLGNYYRESGRALEALKAYRRATEVAPNDSRGWAELGATQLGTDQLDRAEEALERAIALRPDDALTASNLGHVRTIQERFEEALELLQRAVQRQPHEAAFHNNLAALYARLGRMEDAFKEASEAMRINPDFAAARQNLGVAAYALGRFEEAAENLDAVLDFDAGNVVALILGGQAHLKSGHREEGIRRLHRLVQLVPHSEEGQSAARILSERKEEYETFVGLAWKQAGVAAQQGVDKMEAGDFDGAEHDFLQAIALCPDVPPADFFEALATARANAGRILDACDAFYRGLERMGQDPSLPLRFARFLMTIEDYFHAIVMLEETLQRGGDLPDATRTSIVGITDELKTRLAQLADEKTVQSALQDYAGARRAQMEGRNEEARALVERSIHAYPRNLDACWILTRILHRTQDFQTMAEMLVAFARFFPALADVHFNAATALRQSGQAARATSFFEQAIHLYPRNPAYRIDYANTLQALGRTDEALAQVVQATEVAPENPLAWYNRAIIERVAGQEDTARDSMRRALEVAPRGPVGALIRSRAQIWEQQAAK